MPKSIVRGSHQFLEQLTNWPLALFMLILTITLFATYNGYVQPLRDLLGEQVYLDIRMGGYEYDEALAFFEFLGAEGRSLYFRTTLFDTVWPLCLAVTGALFAPLAFRSPGLVLASAFFPVMFGVFDLLENIGIFIMLSAFPDISKAAVSYSNLMTVTKQLAIPGAFIAFLGLPLLAAIASVRRNRASS